MKAKIIHVLCEGQTEQGFVEAVLKPYLIKNGFINRTPRGRVVTELAYHHLGL